MTPYFAYGSNLWIDQMNRRCPESTVVGKGVLHGYRWIITTRGYASIVVSDEDEVHGVVYAMKPDDVCSLDTHEGVASGLYVKRILNVLQAGQGMECLVYIDPVTDEGVPHDEYIHRINEGLKDSDLSKAYVSKYIRKFIPA